MIYRNYLVPVAGGIGQTSDRQLDGLADLGAALAKRLGTPVEALWTMRNGYALATKDGLAAIAALLTAADGSTLDDFRGLLRVGLHTDGHRRPSTGTACQLDLLFGAAGRLLGMASSARAPFARLVLEAAYEATLLAGELNAPRGASNRVLRTRLGGGAFGNDYHWIDEAIGRALQLVGDHDLDVAIVLQLPIFTPEGFVQRFGSAPAG